VAVASYYGTGGMREAMMDAALFVVPGIEGE